MAAGLIAAGVSGIPSTAHALLTGAGPLEATLAAGTLVLPHEDRALPLVLAALPAHAAVSLGWGVVLSVVLPSRHPVTAGAAAGLAIAALDLGIVARRYPRIRALPLLPQVADHLAYGVVVGAVLARRRARRRGVRRARPGDPCPSRARRRRSSAVRSGPGVVGQDVSDAVAPAAGDGARPR